jgi:1-acyl-sn-glycerol-3-phosphate acyltransferase
MQLLTGILSTVLVVSNIVLNSIPLYLMGLVRVIVRLLGLKGAEARVANRMDLVIDSWAAINRALFSALGLSRVDIQWCSDQDLSRDRWYMVISNHQSWTDILILQTELHSRIPALKFFTKRQLLWVPFLGQAMWLLDFPYVKRLSRDQIEANPELLKLDRQATLEACEKFKNHPTSALNFLEGTRCTPEKHAAQPAPRFRHLLNPKVGGLTHVLTALDDRLHKLIDVTIDYPDGVPTFWEFMQGRCPNVTMRVQCRDIPAAITQAADDESRRQATADWVESLWQEKDQRLEGAALAETTA